MRNRNVILFIIFIVVLVLTTGCARASRQTDTAVAHIGLTTIPYPPVRGESRLVLHVTNLQDQPINDAQISIKGNMTHAGMVPLFAETAVAENGYYELPIRWTMGGDWIVQVDAQLADGSVAQQQFDLRVLTEDELCNLDHEQ